MPFVFKHTWILFIAATIANALILKLRARPDIESDPDLKPGYDKMFWGFLFWRNLPWAVMAIGDLTGMTNGVFVYFRPKSMNPAVLIFHLTIVVIWVLGCKWIYLGGGAYFIARHPGLVRIDGIGGLGNITSPVAIKFFWGICMLSGIAAMTSMWLLNFPTPAFK